MSKIKTTLALSSAAVLLVAGGAHALNQSSHQSKVNLVSSYAPSYKGDFVLTDSDIQEQNALDDLKDSISDIEDEMETTVDQQVAGNIINQNPDDITESNADNIIKENVVTVNDLPDSVAYAVEKLTDISVVDAEQNQENTLETLANTTTSSKVKTIFHNNEITATKIYVKYVEASFLSSAAASVYRAVTFSNLVKQGGAWDIKQTLGYNTNYTLYGKSMNGDDVGNAHYAYMGKIIGYGDTMLHTAGGIVQIATGHSNLS